MLSRIDDNNKINPVFSFEAFHAIPSLSHQNFLLCFSLYFSHPPLFNLLHFLFYLFPSPFLIFSFLILLSPYWQDDKDSM